MVADVGKRVSKGNTRKRKGSGKESQRQVRRHLRKGFCLKMHEDSSNLEMTFSVLLTFLPFFLQDSTACLFMQHGSPLLAGPRVS